MKSWWYWFKGGLSVAECNAVIEYCKEQPLKPGTVGYGSTTKLNTEIRQSNIGQILRSAETQWLFDRIALRALKANKDCFYLALNNEPDLEFRHLQFTEYDAAQSGHYDWHTDNCWVPAQWSANDRKLSCVIQLTDPASYSGGQLELEGQDVTRASNQGDIIFFPSHLRHRVTPVTAGVRHSLVTWIIGPRLK